MSTSLTNNLEAQKKKGFSPKAFLKNTLRAGVKASKTAANAAPKRMERYTSSDWFRNIKSLLLLQSDITRRISGHLLFNVALAAVGAAWFDLYPETFWKIPNVGHSLSGAALSLLLVFRTNSAYDRFWEARKILGSVVDNSRGLSRVAPTALPPAMATEFGRMIVAFPYLLRLHLTGRGQEKIDDTSDAPDVLPFIDPEKQATMESYFSKPMACLSIMNQMLNSKDATYADEDTHETLKRMPQRQILQENVNQLVAKTGACERIQGCPVPLSYSRHLSRYLTIWAGTLPLVLAPMLGWVSIPVITLICWSLFSIEEVGHMIEEPFAALPYDQVQTKRVADVIKRDTVAMYDQQLGVDLATREVRVA
jgi:putative membrane protein